MCRHENAVLRPLLRQDNRADRRAVILTYSGRAGIENPVRHAAAYVDKRPVAVYDAGGGKLAPQLGLRALADAARAGEEDRVPLGAQNIRAVQHEHPALGEDVKQVDAFEQQLRPQILGVPRRDRQFRKAALGHGVGEAEHIILQRVPLRAGAPAIGAEAAGGSVGCGGHVVGQADVNLMRRGLRVGAERGTQRRQLPRRLAIQVQRRTAKAQALTEHR